MYDRKFIATATSKIIAYVNSGKPGQAKAWLVALNNHLDADKIMEHEIEINPKKLDDVKRLEANGVTLEDRGVPVSELGAELREANA